MLHIILPPIVIALGVALLVWIVVRKRRVLFREYQEDYSKEKEDSFERKSALPEESVGIRERIIRKIPIFQRNIYQKKLLLQTKKSQEKKKASIAVTGVKKSNKVQKVGTTQSQGKYRERKQNEKKSIAQKGENKYIVEDKDQYEEILIERIALNPRDIEAYERLGDYYMERKGYGDAKECYKQVLKLSPVNRKARVCMRKLERILGQ